MPGSAAEVVGSLIYKEDSAISKVPIYNGTVYSTVNHGDAVKYTSNVATQLAAAGDIPNFLGVSNDTNPVVSLGNNESEIKVITDGIVRWQSDEAVTYYIGDIVTLGSTPQRVKKTGASAGNALGVVASENGYGNSGKALAVAAEILIRIQPKHVLSRTFAIS